MISLQTNVDAMDALQNLNVDNQTQSQTIQQLSSGYRINSSADDAAGLAVANGYQNEVTQLTQGVSNANDGIAQLQIIDGGLSNISTILNRMQTLATESASGTFTGSRATLNQEYQSLIGEVTRQASNINLNNGGSFNNVLSVYIGGASNAANATVSVDLSGSTSAVDATSLGLDGTNVLGGGTSFGGGSATNLNDPNAVFNVGAAGTSEDFQIYYTNSSGSVQNQTVSVAATSAGVSGSTFVSELNSAISAAGINGVQAQIGSDGTLQLAGANLLSATTSLTGTPTSLAAASAQTLVNSANYSASGAYTAFGAGDAESLTITAGGQEYSLSLNHTNDATQAAAITDINSQLQGSGVYAVANGTNIVLQSTSSFSVDETGQTGTGNWFGTTTGTQTVTSPSQSDLTGSATNAIAAIAQAIQNLGLVQGRVGAGENQLQYAISLAQSQITNVSTAESDIKDANVAQDASNLTKSQVLEQTAIAALAQANSEPQNVLKLLQG